MRFTTILATAALLSISSALPAMPFGAFGGSGDKAPAEGAPNSQTGAGGAGGFVGNGDHHAGGNNHSNNKWGMKREEHVEEAEVDKREPKKYIIDPCDAACEAKRLHGYGNH